MRKEIGELLGTLQKSLVEIAGSAADDREDLMTKSMDQFGEALMDMIGPSLPLSEENAQEEHPVMLFHHSLSKLAGDMELIKAAFGNDATADATLDRLMDAGALTLRALASDSVEPIETDRQLRLAERDGTLVKITSFDGEDMLLKSDLPDVLQEFICDPMELMAGSVDISRAFLDIGLDIAEPMVKAELIPLDFADAYPELFEPLAKAFPPKRKPAPGEDPAGGAAPDPGDAGQEEDPDDGGQGADDGGQDMGDTAGDDVTQNPIETAVRLASIIVVVLGSVLQAGGQDQGGQSMPPDQAGAGGGMPLQRSEPLEDIPLAKILSGEIAVSDSVAEALEEREALRKSAGTLTTQRDKLAADLAKMQATLAQLQKQAAPAPKGVVFAVDKTGEMAVPGAKSPAEQLGKLEEMAKSNPEAAAREAMKMIHAGGGVPLIASDAPHRT